MTVPKSHGGAMRAGATGAQVRSGVGWLDSGLLLGYGSGRSLGLITEYGSCSKTLINAVRWGDFSA
jgi:hypothetical protein